MTGSDMSPSTAPEGMGFPEHIARILDAYGVAADTKAALFDLYVTLGDEVLEVFADLAENVASASMLRPEDTRTIRARVVERYVRRSHPRWLAGTPTPSLWHPRELGGRASGVALPLGELPVAARRVVGENQPLPDGVLVVGRNAHSGGRQETVSFDVVARELDDALALGRAEGQQHTMPGSVGETSATYDAIRGVALIWEIQPNVFKPSGPRNREIAKVYRRHRNWHLVTLTAAIEWLRQHETAVYIVRGAGLATTHEMNPAAPLAAEIPPMYDRTVARVLDALGMTVSEPTEMGELALLDSMVMNHALRQHVLREGAAGVIGRIG